MIENVLKNYTVTFEQILPMLQKRSKASYIGAAILLLAVQQVYSFFTPPKYLRSFPRVSFLAMIKSFYINESIFQRNKKLVAPLMNAGHKLYVSRLPITWTVYITDPNLAKKVLLKTENFPKSSGIFEGFGNDSPIIKFLGNDNVAVSNGHKWKNQRKIMNPAFSRSMPVKTFGAVVPHLFALIDQESENVPITTRMKSFTLDVLGLAAFGFDFQSLKGDPEGWTKTYNIFIVTLFNPWAAIFSKLDFLVKYFSAERRRVDRATDKFNDMIDALTNKRRQDIENGLKNGIPENEKDLLTLMIEADMREDGNTSTEELRHNIALFFLAGHDTTAHTLTFCLYNLAKNKDIQRKLREEILNVLGDEPVDVFPTLEELKQMNYINMVIKENLRHSGPVDMLMSRIASEDFDLDGFFLPKGTKVSVDISALHLSEKNWKDPELFLPERFEDGGEHDDHSGFSWVPFSNGSRQCLGMNFSLTEQRVVLAMMLRKYEIDIPENSIHRDRIVYDKPFNFAPDSLDLKFTKRY
ncbi:cytochrome P450 [Thamnidium elegans]|uniref:Cytochrome P450 n=1 Tax=Thamnidium elegans TaxID=101142 RepID=A0A8H7VYN5_9FUNG|nr:hypothetical protein INT48_008617 [Thamnidium elegans]KAI8056457.1 cytochrome P450 [Thamnidium elegans]BDB32870.1 cytochrome P450 monooxygenase [Thamnidium elegans]